MKSLVILEHGFANPGGKNTTDRFVAGFEALGCTVVPYDYWWHAGWWSAPFSLAQVRLANGAIANGLRLYTLLARQVYDHIAIVAHSNGGAIAHAASQNFVDEHGVEQPGAHFDSAVLINPALDSDAVFGPHTQHVFCLHTPWDPMPAISAALPFHWWGDAGSFGFDNGDPRTVNINMATHREYPIRSHNGLMSLENLNGYWEAEVQRLAIGGLSWGSANTVESA